MDDRHGAPPSDETPKPFNQNRNFKSDGAKNFEPRRTNQQYPRGGRFQKQDERIQNQGVKSQPAAAERFQLRRDKSEAGGDKSRNDDRKFQPKRSFSHAKNKSFKPRREQEQPLPAIVSELQITDGKHRGKYLQTTDSARVRPTTRRVREVMFRILYKRVRGGRFLDLCAGSGMVGLEAVSRGALLATFVERSAKMCSIVRRNMESCTVKIGHGEVVQAEAAPFLKRMEKRRRRWDIVFYDPPFDADYDEILNFFARGAALKARGVLVIEHHSEMFFPETFGAMSRWRVLVQNDTALSFYEKK